MHLVHFSGAAFAQEFNHFVNSVAELDFARRFQEIHRSGTRKGHSVHHFCLFRCVAHVSLHSWEFRRLAVSDARREDTTKVRASISRSRASVMQDMLSA